MRVGFIGLGSMGRSMAENLVKAGHELIVWNRSRAPIEALEAAGAKGVDTPEQALDADVLISMLADDAVTRTVLLDSGALDVARPGLIHLSMATLSVDFVAELTRRHRERDLIYIAAPVFGRATMAPEAKLNFAVAGPAEAIEKVQPLLDAMGQKTWPMGDEPVSANVLKLAGNLMLASAIETMGEAMALTQRYGIDNERFVDFITSTLFAAPAYKTYGPLIASRQIDDPAFTLKLGLKDVGLAMKAGEKHAVPLPLASLLRDNLLQAVAHGDADKDLAGLGVWAIRRSGQN